LTIECGGQVAQELDCWRAGGHVDFFVVERRVGWLVMWRRKEAVGKKQAASLLLLYLEQEQRNQVVLSERKKTTRC